MCQWDTLSIPSLLLLSPDSDTSSVSWRRLIEGRETSDTSYLAVPVPKVSPRSLMASPCHRDDACLELSPGDTHDTRI